MTDEPTWIVSVTLQGGAQTIEYGPFLDLAKAQICRDGHIGLHQGDVAIVKELHKPMFGSRPMMVSGMNLKVI